MLKKSYAETQQKYGAVNFIKGPSTYKEKSNYNLLYSLGEFHSNDKYVIGDLGCGKGLVGIEVAKRVRKNNSTVDLVFIDIVPENLKKIRPGPRKEKRLSDLRKINAKNNEFTHTYCRYAIKNMAPKDQINSLKEIARVTKKRGIFVLQDMVSHEGLQEFQNNERAAKDLITGDKITKGYVPTEKQWKKMLEKAGFAIKEIRHTESKVHTRDWVKSKQTSAKTLGKYFDFLKSAKKRWPKSWNAYKIKKSAMGYKIVFPIIIFKCNPKK